MKNLFFSLAIITLLFSFSAVSCYEQVRLEEIPTQLFTPEGGVLIKGVVSPTTGISAVAMKLDFEGVWNEDEDWALNFIKGITLTLDGSPRNVFEPVTVTPTSSSFEFPMVPFYSEYVGLQITIEFQDYSLDPQEYFGIIPQLTVLNNTQGDPISDITPTRPLVGSPIEVKTKYSFLISTFNNDINLESGDEELVYGVSIWSNVPAQLTGLGFCTTSDSTKDPEDYIEYGGMQSSVGDTYFQTYDNGIEIGFHREFGQGFEIGPEIEQDFNIFVKISDDYYDDARFQLYPCWVSAQIEEGVYIQRDPEVWNERSGVITIDNERAMIACHDSDGDGHADSCDGFGNMRVGCDPDTFNVETQTPAACFPDMPEPTAHQQQQVNNFDR